MNFKWKTWMAAGMTALFILPATSNMASAYSTGDVDNKVSTSSSTSSAKPCTEAGHGLFMIGETADLLGIGLRDLKEQMELGKTLTQIAKERKGISEEQLLQQLKPSLAKRLDQAAQEGCLSKEQAAAAKAGIDSKLKKVINTPLRELRREFVSQRRQKPAIDQKVIAQFIGITPEQLHEQLKSGKSLAEVAKAHGVSETQLVEKLKEQLTDDLQRLVNRKGGTHPVPHEHAPGRSASTQAE